MTVADVNGKIKYANAKLSELSGYSQEELLDKTHRVLGSMHHDKIFFNDLWTTISSGEIWRGEIKNQSKNGQFYWADSNIVPIRNSAGKITEFVSIQIDITQKKDADGLYREVIETNPERFWLVDTQGQIIDVNQSYLNLSGYTREEVLKKSISDIDVKKDSALIKDEIDGIIKSGYARFETTLQRKDGSKIDFEISASYFSSRNGVLTVFCRDISEVKKLVKLLTAEKERANALGEAKTRFLSTMSHEIRTPLNGILGLVTLMLDAARDKEQRSDLQNILIAGESLNHTINIDPAIPKSLIGDSFRIRQILTNLVGNAIKFTERGNVSLLTKLVELNEERADILFTVLDTGIGINSSVFKNSTS